MLPVLRLVAPSKPRLKVSVDNSLHSRCRFRSRPLTRDRWSNLLSRYIQMSHVHFIFDLKNDRIVSITEYKKIPTRNA